MRQSELQQDIERFATRFMEAVAEAVTPLTETDAKTRELAVRRTLLYTSSALEIASSTAPEIALLDMIVFIGLSRRVLESHWIPTAFGEKGEPLNRAFVEGEKDLLNISSKVLGAEQQSQLQALIEDWLKDNPGKTRVEAIRLSDFARVAGRLSDKRAKETSGLFGTMKSATVAADEALLLGERALFIAHRLPFLVRLQARLAASEIISDALQRIGDVKQVIDRMPEIRPLLDEVDALARDSKSTLLEANATLRALEPVVSQVSPILAQLPAQTELQKTIGGANLLADKADALLGQARSLLPANPGQSGPAITAAADHLVRRWAVYALLIGAGWSLFFWGGYYVFKRLTVEQTPAAQVMGESSGGRDTDHRGASPSSHR